MAGKRWIGAEIELLKHWYAIEGIKCHVRLVGRSVGAVRIKVRALDLPRVCVENRWTEEELNILKEWYPLEGIKGTAARLIGRNESATKQQAKLLKISAPDISWTEEEITILREFYPTESTDCHLRLTRRSETAIKGKANIIGIKAARIWTAEEVSILRTYYPLDGRDCYARLNNRNKKSTTAKAVVLGIKAPDAKLTNEEYDLHIVDRSFIRIGEYTGSAEKTEHKCLDCNNIWYPKPTYILHRFSGCPVCNKGGINYRPGTKIGIYLVRITTKTEVFLKVGVSIKLSNRMIKLKRDAKATVVTLIYSISGLSEHIVPLERKILRLSGLKQHHPEVKFGGHTECLELSEEAKVMNLMTEYENNKEEQDVYNKH